MKFAASLSILMSLIAISQRSFSFQEISNREQKFEARQSLRQAMPYIQLSDSELKEIINEIRSKPRKDPEEEVLVDTLKKLLREREILKVSSKSS